MPRLHTLTRTLAAAMAIVALAAPVAAARPVDTPKAGHAATPSQRVQDLRHLKAGQIHTSSLAGTTSSTWLGSPGPVYWSYDYAAPVPGARAATADGGTPWMTIGFGVAGVCLLVGAGAAMAGRTRLRLRRARVAA